MPQQDLFATKTISRSTDPQSSHEAAKRLVRSGHRRSQAQTVLETLRLSGDWMFASEISSVCGLQAYVVRKRLPELEREGLVERQMPLVVKEQIWKARR